MDQGVGALESASGGSRAAVMEGNMEQVEEAPVAVEVETPSSAEPGCASQVEEPGQAHEKDVVSLMALDTPHGRGHATIGTSG